MTLNLHSRLLPGLLQRTVLNGIDAERTPARGFDARGL